MHYLPQQHTSGFSSVLALVMIGFLLMATLGVFQLVLREMYDNRGLEYSFQAQAGAQSAGELALLAIKQKGYGYYEAHPFGGDSGVNHILAEDPNNPSKRDIEISFDLNTRINSYDGNLEALGYDILPLFYMTGSTPTVFQIDDITLTSPASISWNLLGSSGGGSGEGDFDTTTSLSNKTVSSQGEITKNTQTIGSFLSQNEPVYLILFNPTRSPLSYRIESSDFFSPPEAYILTSAKKGDKQQNLRIYLDNTQYLNTLKYAIYGR
ncbi:hypothetical protein MK079_00130 [Candidatus Gracilibacteria bacterium]|nr:hypothetical protein [Candidatus Gracilibacteria bacterium]